MSLLKKLLPPEDQRFYTQFEDAAEICWESAKLFHEIILEKLNEDRFIQAKTLKHKSADLAKKTLSDLNATFVTPIDREDIVHVAFLLNKITKRIIRGCVNLKVYRLETHPEILRLQAETLVKATAELKTVVSNLRKTASLKQVEEAHKRMMEIETHGDEILFTAMEQLFSGEYQAIDILKLKDIYKNIESAMDNCFHVSDNIVNIVLKHS